MVYEGSLGVSSRPKGRVRSIKWKDWAGLGVSAAWQRMDKHSLWASQAGGAFIFSNPTRQVAVSWKPLLPNPLLLAQPLAPREKFGAVLQWYTPSTTMVWVLIHRHRGWLLIGREGNQNPPTHAKILRAWPIHYIFELLLIQNCIAQCRP